MANWSIVTRVHGALYRATGGRVGQRLGGLDMLLLTTRGRKSGQPRTLPLACFVREPVVLVVASNNGQDHHPAWWLNLEAHPHATVQLGRDEYEADARLITGDERAELWPWLVERNPMYARYAEKTRREIPVVSLARR